MKTLKINDWHRASNIYYNLICCTVYTPAVSTNFEIVFCESNNDNNLFYAGNDHPDADKTGISRMHAIPEQISYKTLECRTCGKQVITEEQFYACVALLRLSGRYALVNYLSSLGFDT